MNAVMHPPKSAPSGSELRLIDVPIVILAAVAVVLFVLWLARTLLLPADTPLVLPSVLTSIGTWIVSASGAGASWLLRWWLSKDAQQPSGEKYLKWIVTLAVLLLVASLFLGHWLLPPAPAPAAKAEIAGNTAAVELADFPTIAVFLSKSEQRILHGEQLSDLSEDARSRIPEFLETSLFHNALEKYSNRAWLGYKETGDAVETRTFGQTACSKVVRAQARFAAHKKLPCGATIEVRANNKSIVIPVLDRPNSNTQWDDIKLALSSAAMKDLGIGGKCEVSFVVVSLPGM